MNWKQKGMVLLFIVFVACGLILPEFVATPEPTGACVSNPPLIIMAIPIFWMICTMGIMFGMLYVFGFLEKEQ